MAPWPIFGTGGSGIGTKTLELVLAEYRPVIAIVRNPRAAAGLQEKGVQVSIGDARDSQIATCACRAAGQHVTVILSTGGAQDYLAHKTVIDGAEKAEIKRMILVASLGCGDSWPFLSPRARAAFGQVVREKSLAESWLRTSLLDYVILRSGDLLNGEATGLVQHIQTEECHGFVMCVDITQYIHELATASALNNQIYSLAGPGLKSA